jgi:hypothetical protein
MRKVTKNLSHQDVFLDLFAAGRAVPASLGAKVLKTTGKDCGYTASLYLEYESDVFHGSPRGSAEILHIELGSLQHHRGDRVIDIALHDARYAADPDAAATLSLSVIDSAQIIAFRRLLGRREAEIIRGDAKVASIAFDAGLLDRELAQKIIEVDQHKERSPETPFSRDDLHALMSRDLQLDSQSPSMRL